MDKLKFIHIAYYCVRTYLNRRVPSCEPPKFLKIVFLRNFCITKTFLHNAIDKFGFLWYNNSIISLASKPLWLRHLHYRANALLYHFAKMPLQASIFACGIIYA